MMCIMAHDVLTLLVDSTCVITVPLWAYPSHCRGPWLRGRSLHTSRLRVCVCLLSVESVRGFPSPWVTFGAVCRVSLSAGCLCGWILQACNFLQLWPGLLTMTLGIIVLFGPSFSWSLTRSSLVQLVLAYDGLHVASLALPMYSFAWWITSVRLGRCLPFHPCSRLSTRLPRGWLTLST